MVAPTECLRCSTAKPASTLRLGALTCAIEWLIDCQEIHDRKCKCGGYREADYAAMELPTHLLE